MWCNNNETVNQEFEFENCRNDVSVRNCSKLNKQVIVKKLKCWDTITDPRTSEELPKEYYVMKTIHEKYQSIVPEVYSCTVESNEATIVMEYLNPRNHWLDLMTYLGTMSLVKTEKVKRDIFKNILTKIESLLQLGIYHMDLKPDNIIVNFVNHDVRLIDFDFVVLSQKFDQPPKCSQAFGTLGFTAPEVWEIGENVNSQCDAKKAIVFSLGCILYTMIEFRFCYRYSNETITLPNALTFHHSPLILQDLLLRCVQYKPENRIKLERIKYHDWFIEY